MALFKKKPAKQQKSSFAPRKQKSRPLLGLVLLAFAVLFLVALVDFEPAQTRWVQAGGETSDNLAGGLGAELAGTAIFYFGISAWLVPLALIYAALSLLFG